LANGPLAWRGFAVAAIAMAAVAQLAMPVRLPAADPINATPAAGVRRAAPPPHPAGLYSAIAEHPLFSPSRQPYVPPKASAPAAVAEHSVLRDYQLLGIVVEGDTRIALLKPPDGHQTIHAVPGQTIAGWKLRQITPQLVEFENGTASLALHFSTPRWPHP
jgi:hypothetical protein